MSNCSGKFRKKRDKFSMVSNLAIRDEDLSLKARGLYSLIQSYITIEKNVDGSDFVLSKEKLLNKCKEGESAFNSAWNELKNKGYIKIYKISTNKGFIYEYELLEEPKSSKQGGEDRKDYPRCDKPSVRKPKPGKTKVGEPITREQQPIYKDNNTRANKTISTNIFDNNNIDDVADQELEDKVVKYFETVLLDSNNFNIACEIKESNIFVEKMNYLTKLVAEQNHKKLQKCLKLSNKQIINLFLDAEKSYDNYQNTFANPDGYVISKLNKLLDEVN